MPIPFLDLTAQYRSAKADIDRAIAQVIEKNAFALGFGVERFEEAFAAFCGVDHCIGVGSGTAALELLLRAYEVGPGDEVITVANSFFATAEAAALVGAVPVLLDCREDDALIDVSQLERAITKRTKVIIPVDLYGQCADMDPVMEIAKKHHLVVIEDACQAHGSTYKGRMAGSLGHAAAFSFYPGKNLGAFGEAGAVTTNDHEIASRVRMLRDHGMLKKYHHQTIGRNERMDGLQGAVLNAKLPYLHRWNEARRKHAEQYRLLLGHAAGTPESQLRERIQLFQTHSDREHNYHLFVVRIANRDKVQKKLADVGISTGIHYPIPIHKQEAYRASGWQVPSLPVSEKLAQEILSLPMYAEMTEGQVEEVCEAVKKAIGGVSRSVSAEVRAMRKVKEIIN